MSSHGPFKESSRQVYESIAEQFSGTRHREWPRVAAFVEALEPGSLLLDAGCGNGKYLLGHPHVLKASAPSNVGTRVRGTTVLPAHLRLAYNAHALKAFPKWEQFV